MDSDVDRTPTVVKSVLAQQNKAPKYQTFDIPLKTNFAAPLPCLSDLELILPSSTSPSDSI